MNIFQKGTLLLEEADILHLIKDRIGLQNFLYQVLETLEKGFRQYATKQITVQSSTRVLF